MRVAILFLLFATSTLAIFIDGGGRGGGGGGGYYSHSSSSSSSSSEEHGHHRPPHRPHRPPHRPHRPPRPPPRPECDEGWLRFERPNGVWCINVVHSGVTNGYFSQPQAQAACAASVATLTGFQNDNERMTVASEALKKLTAAGGQIAGLWLGATNTPNCKVASCGPYATYTWTDGDTTGNGGFKWGRDEPDNLNWPGPTICIQQFIMQPNWVVGPNDYAVWKNYFTNGDLDKYQCGAQAYPFTRMYVCGKRGVSR